MVPWNEAKIEIAVRKAFLSLVRRLERRASDIAHAVTERVAEINQAFVQIEEVQDMVQEELMRAGHYKVAEQLYPLPGPPGQIGAHGKTEGPRSRSSRRSMVIVRREDGDTYLWDGADLKTRIEFGHDRPRSLPDPRRRSRPNCAVRSSPR